LTISSGRVKARLAQDYEQLSNDQLAVVAISRITLECILNMANSIYSKIKFSEW